ncbi:DNA/RNA non-specific endonuclease [Furfurilactobacillus siliginis]|uniref:DNA nuclease n=1 Tax=Furfurilactobacillus siliginis TaxID=348151 RepID=A0A510VRP5_9LACO|nr:DNA/RNA non-specific endonuclease [Furfurilactobacillus siliginis]GEK29638.1 DNA nuclease [Furfurilactobacillus siliginis]
MRNRQNRTYALVAVLVIAIVIGAFALSRSSSKPTSTTTTQSSQQTGGEDKSEDLTKLAYHSGDDPVVTINHNRSTLKADAWQNNHVIYSNLDDLNRTTAANTAYLEARNVANDSLRVRQYVQPSGWHQKMDQGQAIINRGHLIAYSLSGGIDQDGHYQPDNDSGDQNNPKNLFTQSAFSNQKLQTIYESKIRTALRQNKHVIFQAQAIFSGNNLMANGVHLQALSTDGQLNFNVYLHNVQPGYQFDYATGRSKKDSSMRVPEPATSSRSW